MISAQHIDAVLPQTQCGECGYPGCLPYAQALSQGLAPINRCPPGGLKTLEALGALLGIDTAPYLEDMAQNTRPPATALIRESECIGCTKCIQACPVDAIIGSGKFMHSILADECTGCGLCVEPCPVDCIEIKTLPEPLYDPNLARLRFNQRAIRLLRDEQDQQQAYRNKRILAEPNEGERQDVKAKQEYIAKAMARVHAKKST